MTIKEAIDQVNGLVPNEIPDEQKIAWLSSLDMKVYRDILKDRKTVGEIPFTGYSECTDLATELLVKEPDTSIYEYWLTKNIAERNGEITRQNNAALSYGVALKEYADMISRTYPVLHPAVPVWW